MMSKMLETKKPILIAQTAVDITSCYHVFQELRPKLKDRNAFVSQIERQNREGYILAYTQDGSETAACMGFRIFETLAWGKILYIDDLITREKSRKKGFGRLLLDFAVEQGRFHQCREIHLDSGHYRYDAHRLYMNSGFTLYCHHFALNLENPL